MLTSRQRKIYTTNRGTIRDWDGRADVSGCRQLRTVEYPVERCPAVEVWWADPRAALRWVGRRDASVVGKSGSVPLPRFSFATFADDDTGCPGFRIIGGRICLPTFSGFTGSWSSAFGEHASSHVPMIALILVEFLPKKSVTFGIVLAGEQQLHYLQDISRLQS